MDSTKVNVIKDINEIYPFIGDGKYQLIVILISCLITFPIGVQEFILFFVAFDPGWKCSNTSDVCAYNATISSTSHLYKKRCDMNRTDWSYAAKKGFSIVTQFDLNCEKEYWIEMSSTIFYLGNLIGAITLGWMSDRFGRSKVAFWSCTVVLIASACSSLVTQLWQFELLRLLTGSFISGTYMVLVILISEITGEKYRAAAGMIVWYFYPGGIALLGGLAYYFQDWRKLLIFTSAPYLALLPFLWFLPESFVWLHANGKKKELTKEVLRILKVNNQNSSQQKITFEFQKNEESSSPNASMTLLLTPSRMKMTLCLMFAWFALGLVYFGIGLAADDLTGDIYRDFVILILMDIPSATIAIFCSSRLGRKVTIITTLIIGSLCVLCVGFIPESTSKSSGYGNLRLSLGIAGKLLTCISFDVIITWCAELYPTNLRSKANGLFNSVSILGSVCAPWVSIWLRHVHASVPFYTMGGCAVVASVALLWLPETKGRDLPQTVSTT